MVEARRGVPESVQAAVIGGGVVGCAVLLELAVRGIEAVLLEAEPDVGEGTSKANSAILHTGFDAKPGTLEATLLRRSTELWPGLLDALAVPSLATGALMLARTADEAHRLEDVADLAASHGVDTELVDRRWLDDLAPYVTGEAVRALHVPDEGIVDPFWLTRAYAEAAIGLGARVRTSATVRGLGVGPAGVEITASDGAVVRAEQAFVCAGIRSDEIARLAGDDSFALTPRKGEFLVSERTAGVDRIVLPIPGPLGKGMLVTPIVFGGVLLGPTADDGHDKADRATTADGRARILAACRELVPAVDEMVPIRSFAGVRSVSSTGDYVIRASTAGDRLTIVAGIRSTGISASPAIAEAAVEVAAASRGWAATARRRAVAPSPDLGQVAGDVVCVCRAVGEAEVAAALAGPTPVRTTDALKRRCGVGFGDCQGNQCLSDAIERVGRAAAIAPSAVEKGAAGSWLVVDARPGGEPRPGTATATFVPSPLVGVRRSEIVVIGGGMSGIGTALGLLDAGRSVTVIDRGRVPGGALAGVPTDFWTAAETTALQAVRDAISGGRLGWLPGATVVAVEPGEPGWRVDVATAGGPVEVTCDRVVLATGGYVTPREHRAIDGPRPSGIVTADFAAAALDRGWLPGRRIVVVGDGRLAAGIAARLRVAGADVVAADTAASPVRAVHGQPRLARVHVGTDWVDADALVLADALSPATFLLRGLGLGDERPGVPAPVDDAGGLALDGLSAVGTCVTPDVDHPASLEAGRRHAASLVAAVAER